MRAVAYIRVSSASQVEGYSLDAQARLFFDACRNRGWQPVRVYREEGRSAHSDSVNKRPQLRQLLRDAAKGEFDLVVVHSLDRWARNVEVLIRTIKHLKEHGVQLQSITESLDNSNPQGRLLLQVLGSFAEFSSDMLAEHVKKGLRERAIQGRRIGGIPFGYGSCWSKEHGEKKLLCDPEHPGGVHLVGNEAQALKELFPTLRRWGRLLWRAGFRAQRSGLPTRNTKKLPDARGALSQEPRLFTAHAVADLLKNRFYGGYVAYKGEYFQGQHDALVSQEIFDLAQDALRKNNGRSRTLVSQPLRQYLLKGIIRCAYCLMPMWAQTYDSGGRYYREHRNSRSHGPCPAVSGSIPCAVVDDQVSRLVTAIELSPGWMEEVMAILALKDQVEDVKAAAQAGDREAAPVGPSLRGRPLPPKTSTTRENGAWNLSWNRWRCLRSVPPRKRVDSYRTSQHSGGTPTWKSAGISCSRCWTPSTWRPRNLSRWWPFSRNQPLSRCFN